MKGDNESDEFLEVLHWVNNSWVAFIDNVCSGKFKGKSKGRPEQLVDDDPVNMELCNGQQFADDALGIWEGRIYADSCDYDRLWNYLLLHRHQGWFDF